MIVTYKLSLIHICNHAQRLGSESFVYNGLDWDDYGPANLTLSRKNYHFLGLSLIHIAFIDAKMTEGKVTGSNVSVKLDDAFMRCV